uniref:Uncharacterized protein n=1 Tax=Parascaris univalens TaxID=6257 RepID=A0A915AGR7_PARUN
MKVVNNGGIIGTTVLTADWKILGQLREKTRSMISGICAWISKRTREVRARLLPGILPLMFFEYNRNKHRHLNILDLQSSIDHLIIIVNVHFRFRECSHCLWARKPAGDFHNPKILPRML